MNNNNKKKKHTNKKEKKNARFSCKNGIETKVFVQTQKSNLI